MDTSDTEQAGMGSWRPPTMPALALYYGVFRLVLGEGPGEPGWCWGTKERQGSGSPRHVDSILYRLQRLKSQVVALFIDIVL